MIQDRGFESKVGACPLIIFGRLVIIVLKLARSWTKRFSIWFACSICSNDEVRVSIFPVAVSEVRAKVGVLCA